MRSTTAPAQVRLAWALDVTVLDLPYGGRAFSMTIVVPRDPAGIDSPVATLTEDRWNAWLGMPHAFCDQRSSERQRRPPGLARPRRLGRLSTGYFLKLRSTTRAAQSRAPSPNASPNARATAPKATVNARSTRSRPICSCTRASAPAKIRIA